MYVCLRDHTWSYVCPELMCGIRIASDPGTLKPDPLAILDQVVQVRQLSWVSHTQSIISSQHHRCIMRQWVMLAKPRWGIKDCYFSCIFMWNTSATFYWWNAALWSAAVCAEVHLNTSVFAVTSSTFILSAIDCKPAMTQFITGNTHNK